MIGRVLGNRYEILEKIGEGGMAHVYKARCKLLNRIVALKVLKDEFSNDEEFLEKFKNEAQSAASLNQQNIINIYDVGQDANISYIVMEYVDGENLKDLIHKKGAVPQELMIDISKQIGLALEEAHNNKIIHRDIKSQNIMLTKSNLVKVADFGIAKAVSSSTITAVGSIMGSVHYFSPEQARGGYIDERSDIYSLGIVMYEMITGRLPFDGDTPVNIALKHIQEEIKFDDNDNISSEIKDIIRKATQKSADRRYKSVDGLVADLEYVKNSKSVGFDFSDETYHTQEIVSDDQYKILFTDVEESNSKSQEKSNKPQKRVESQKNSQSLTKKGIWAVAGLALLASLVFVSGVFMFSTFGKNQGNKKIEAPYLVGMTIEQAETETEQYEILILKEGEEINNRYEAGQIVSQTPESGTKILTGDTIKVIIAAEKIEEVEIPTLVGKSLSQAEKLVKEQGLEMLTEYKFDNAESETVIDQLPKAGEKIQVGKVVKVTVSLGKEENNIELPTVLGKTEQEAKTILKDFDVKASYREDKNKAEGIVLSQNPSPGQKMSAGSEVGIVVNRYEKPKEISYSMIISLPKDSTSTRVQIKEVETDTFIYDKTVNPSELGGVLEVQVQGLPGESKNYLVYLDSDYNNVHANPKVQF